MNEKMTDRLIDTLRPMLNHDHREWAANQHIQTKSRYDAIDKHRFGYHISTLKTTILQREMELVVLLEDLAPIFPLALFLPLNEKQCTVIQDYDPDCIRVAGLGVYRLQVNPGATGGKPEYIHFASMSVMLDCRAGVIAYFDAVSLMQRELAKLLERAEHIVRMEVPWK